MILSALTRALMCFLFPNTKFQFKSTFCLHSFFTSQNLCGFALFKEFLFESVCCAAHCLPRKRWSAIIGAFVSVGRCEWSFYFYSSIQSIRPSMNWSTHNFLHTIKRIALLRSYKADRLLLAKSFLYRKAFKLS